MCFQVIILNQMPNEGSSLLSAVLTQWSKIKHMILLLFQRRSVYVLKMYTI